MKDIDNIMGTAGETVEYARQHIEQRLQYLKLEAVEKTAKSLSAIFLFLVFTLLILLSLIMLSIAVGFFLGKMLESYSLSFLLIAGFYIFCILIVGLFKVSIVVDPITSLILKSFFYDEKE